MRKSLAVLLALIVAAPAYAKSKPDVFPVPCNVLWSAVKNTLENPKDYGLLAVNDLTMRASFMVVGNLVRYSDRVALTEEGGGCRMDLRMLQVGPDNSDTRGFRHRLKRSLAIVEKAKSGSAGESQPPSPVGQQ
jgi:hypothetical protein